MRLLAALVVSTAAHAAEPVELAEFIRLTKPAPTEILHYGNGASQAIDLFLPEGDGPHPVAILLHGGCWRDLPDAGREQLRHMGKALAELGIAAWSIGYRRADEAGGGYPGTFQDVAAALDRLPREAARLRLDPSRSVAVGHSAGGHLALWAAVRDRLPPGSSIRGAAPFVPRSTISLAGIGDLRRFARFIPVHCGPGILDRLVPASASADLYAEISPAEMPAPAGRVVLVSGVLDRLVPPYVAHDYQRAVGPRGTAPIERVEIPDAGHFDFVTPGTRAWADLISRITASLTAPR
ncbi:alpha/beta hydrolase [Paracraurococcus ruber]|nr:alpha/beta hydrolase [Paracraurococcus ruber]